jgi:hypothetical protein
LTLVAAFSIAYVPAVRAGEVVLQPGPGDGKDTCWGTVYVDGVTQPCYDNPSMYTGGWGDFYYNYFEFNLTGAPGAAETVSAVLHLYFNHAGLNDPAFEIHRVTEPWTESGVTRYNNPAATFYRTWGTPIVNTAWYTVDITDLYIGWQNGTYPNYGIKLVPTRNDRTNGSVHTAEYGDPALRPKLVITNIKKTQNPKDLHVAFVKVATDLTEPGSIPIITGHSWIEVIELQSGERQTWGTWGNESPQGLYQDKELDRIPAASRSLFVTQKQYDTLMKVVGNYEAKGESAWSLWKNCTQFAKDGWKSVSQETIDTLLIRDVGFPRPIWPNPISVLYSILELNDGLADRTTNTCNSAFCVALCPPFAALCE